MACEWEMGRLFCECCLNGGGQLWGVGFRVRFESLENGAVFTDEEFGEVPLNVAWGR